MRYGVILVFNWVKVPCISGAGVLRDVGRTMAPDIVPIHAFKERMTTEIIKAISTETNLGITDQSGRGWETLEAIYAHFTSRGQWAHDTPSLSTYYCEHILKCLHTCTWTCLVQIYHTPLIYIVYVYRISFKGGGGHLSLLEMRLVC